MVAAELVRKYIARMGIPSHAFVFVDDDRDGEHVWACAQGHTDCLMFYRSSFGRPWWVTTRGVTVDSRAGMPEYLVVDDFGNLTQVPYPFGGH